MIKIERDNSDDQESESSDDQSMNTAESLLESFEGRR